MAYNENLRKEFEKWAVGLFDFARDGNGDYIKFHTLICYKYFEMGYRVGTCDLFDLEKQSQSNYQRSVDELIIRLEGTMLDKRINNAKKKD